MSQPTLSTLPTVLRTLLLAAVAPGLFLTGTASAGERAALLFHLSADHGTTADLAAPGTHEPTFAFEVSTVADGARGPALSCGHLQRLAWRAPGNIHAQRGTLAFFWRSREPVGPTEFPVFRVGYADHSSWDMVWLRIDYNGRGFDAFVTDTGLARLRVSTTIDPFPDPGQWVHLAFSWDETVGIRLHVDGRLAAALDQRALLDAGLDQFGPHSRIISPYQVQSDYNFVRGGDIDEIRIYDRMLDDGSIAALATGAEPAIPAAPPLDLADERLRDAWWWRHGWNRPDDPPPALDAAVTRVRKVEIHDAFDLPRWWWKACDGIRETTWPGVYNRSRLPGRNDYFQLPDWDCYSLSGWAIRFRLPDEPVNHLEITGPAWGTIDLAASDGESGEPARLFQRPAGQGRTTHRLGGELRDAWLRFTNAEQETPIEELAAYHVAPGAEPAGTAKLEFTLTAHSGHDDPALAALEAFIRGRHPAGERATMIALPTGAPATTPAAPVAPPRDTPAALPLVHILVPNTWDGLVAGLDGIVLDLPALPVRPTHGSLHPLNLRVKDPLWPARDLLDFSFSVRPGEAHTLWLDLRDRILPAGRPFHLALAGAGSDFGPALLEGARLRLVFKDREAARAEHEIDRFTQVRDVYAMLVEENPRDPRYALWNRFTGDLGDLLRVNPNHVPGLNYAAAAGVPGHARPPFIQPQPPDGVPLWAFRQVELLKGLKRFVHWYIDHRQIENGELGGGLSDDTDLTNLWPALALLGGDPDKVARSVRRVLDACYANGMVTNGLPTIQTDELHSYEEGINALGQVMLLDFGSPRQIERAMETTRGIESITGVNAAGHRHIRSSYYSGTRIAEEGVWGWSKAYSNLVLQVPQLLVDYNGQPHARQWLLELTDGLLAHRRERENGRFELPGAIHFATDAEGRTTRNWFPWPMFWTAWQWTGERRYLDPILDGGTTTLMSLNPNALDLLELRAEWGPRIVAGETGRAADGRAGSSATVNRRVAGPAHFAWQISGSKEPLEVLYARQIEQIALTEYINTEGSLWIDRVGVPNIELQRARLGGTALVRNSPFPGHVVGWRFDRPGDEEQVAILIPDATRTRFTVIAHNLAERPVSAAMTGWQIDPGLWTLTQGVDGDGDDRADRDLATRTVPFERSVAVRIELPPGETTVLSLALARPGTPYWQRPDLGLDPGDVVAGDGGLRVTVHSLGSVPAPASTIALRNRDGAVLARAVVPPLPAPLDLLPKTAEVLLPLPPGAVIEGCSIEIDPDGQFEEITKLNNRVDL